VITIATVHMHDMVSHPDALSRVLQGVIQGVMAGIGFIGAGVIMRDPEAQVVQGLTTAATVWITAALGVACGLAAWPLAGLALALALFVLAGVGGLEGLLSRDDR
jgi:putative Mg2+ transporter-C (MgtC) family protein